MWPRYIDLSCRGVACTVRHVDSSDHVYSEYMLCIYNYINIYIYIKFY